MNYTENYHLPQWAKEDRIMMDDFNRMCLDIEHGLAQTAAGAAADTAKAAASAEKAQTTANKAVADAAAAQATANAAYCPTNLPYVTGTYVGTNAEITISLGFRPSFVIITCADGRDAGSFTLPAGHNINSDWLEFTSSGFKVKKNVYNSSEMSSVSPLINSVSKQYVYIAFR